MGDNNTAVLIIKAIVAEQKSIIGPMAVDLANKVNGVHISNDLVSIEVGGNTVQVLGDLVKQYEKLFGKASIEACKESIREANISISSKDLPAVLQ